MFITGYDEIINVWANDAAKVSIFIFVLSIYFLVYILLSFKKDIFQLLDGKSVFNRNLLRYFFSFNILINIISLAGIGQLILEPVLDSLARSVGILFYFSGLLFYINLTNECKNLKNKNDFFNNRYYKIVRNPDFAMLVMIAFGSSMLALSFFGIIISLVIFLPLTAVFLQKEEKELLKVYKKYYDYKTDVPLLIPNITKLIKIAVYRKHF